EVVREKGRDDVESGPVRGQAIALGAFAGVAFACSAPPPPPPSLPTTSRVSGQVVEVDSTANRVVILDGGHRLAVSYGPETIIKKGVAALAPTDIHHGDRVVVSLAPEGVAEARVIAVAGSRPTRSPAPSQTPGPSPSGEASPNGGGSP